MNMYWVYELPNWLFGILTVLAFVAIGLVGLYPTRGWIRRVHAGEHSHNDIVGFYMAGVTVLYAVSVGLLAIGAWATYSEVQGKTDHEAAVLAGLYRDISVYPEPERSIMLCSPIILYDYPKIAPESEGDFFDGTEMDEMLTLRVLTLTDAEKQEMLNGDPRARRILERTEALTSDAMLKAHGDWMDMGGCDEQKEPKPDTFEAWGRSPSNPVSGWYGLKSGLRGRFGVYVPPVLEVLGLAEVEHEPRNNRMRAI